MKDIKQQFEDPLMDTQRYVLGQMSEMEAQDFEAYFLARPDIIELVEVTQKMHFGLKANDGISSNTQKTVEKKLGFSRLLNWLTVPVPAFAVVAMVAVLSPLALNSLSSNSNLDGNLASEMELINFTTVATRSSGYSQPTINISNVADKAAVLIKVKSVKHKEYKLRLMSGGDSQALWSSEPFQVSALRDRLVTIPKLDIEGDLTLDVVGINPDLSETSVEFCHYSEVCM